MKRKLRMRLRNLKFPSTQAITMLVNFVTLLIGLVIFITLFNLQAQNNQIARESQTHIDCIADLFARFTRDQKPITIIDLNTCQAKATAASKQVLPIVLVPAPAPSPQPVIATPSPQITVPAPQPHSTTSSSSSQPPKHPNVIQRIINNINSTIDRYMRALGSKMYDIKQAIRG